MSHPSHFQPWKQNRPPLVLPLQQHQQQQQQGSYGKLPAMAHQQQLPEGHLHLHQQQQQQFLLGGGNPQQQQQTTLAHLPPPTPQPAPVIQSAAVASSSSNASNAISSSTAAGTGPGATSPGAMSDFLSQLGANKLMLGKLSASYGLLAMDQNSQQQPGQIVTGQQQQLHQPASGLPGPLDDCANDKERELRIQQIFENAISENSKKQIVDILEKVSILRPPERLLLYLRMPGGYPETDPLRQSQNPLGTRSEINHTINWVRSHLEHDPNVSIPKQEVYDDYTSYCERIDIKPLSTADFGKVMKQVFPGIRPRRLGTRGHSRYCYAAMRKATKLAAPKLPDLSTGDSGDKPEQEEQMPTDEEAWKVIKFWAEAMLPSAFGSINELAGFITRNNLNSPASIASRQLLQKKLLQRENKERKKLTAAAMKKRRRKRRKTTSASIDSEVAPSEADGPATPMPPRASPLKGQHPPNLPSVGDILQQTIKNEQPEFTDEDNNNNPSVALSKQQQQQQHLQVQSTNFNCDTNNGSLAAVAAAVAIREMRSPAEYNIFCKKVRQAQQLKAQQMSQLQAPSQTSQTIPGPIRPTSAAAKRAATIAQLNRQKRLRLLQQHQQQSIEAQNNTAPAYDEMGNLILIDSNELVTSSRDDFIIPRERVISICNMDKNALDGYLNCDEENSQDQDQELLQYFPDENQADGSNNALSMNSSGIESSSGIGNSLEHNENSLKLSQLRSMLEQNMNAGGTDKVGGQLDSFDGASIGQQMNLQPGSAAASLAMLSQRHQGSSVGTSGEGAASNNSGVRNSSVKVESSFNSVGKNAVGSSGQSSAPLQSPNGRRKNYNFVPISAGPQSPRGISHKTTQQNSTPNASPFVSPRNTPIHRKNKPPSNGLTVNISHQGQLPGYQQRPSFVKNEFPSSAPPSPSLMPNYRFSMNPNNLHCSNNMIPSFQPICGPSSQMQPHPNLPGSLESRSSSVPLIPNYEAFNHSNFTSVSQTPVPSECEDFNDPNNILDMLTEPSSSDNIQQSIKLEETEPNIADILDQDDMFQKTAISSFNNLSRSVPSTPLPHQISFNPLNAQGFATLNASNSKSLFELPKSVPSTPSISLNNGNREQLFLYSPETSRDFLINGNSVERSSNGKLNSFYQTQAATGNNPNSSSTTNNNNNGSVPTNSVTHSGNASANNGATAPEMSILSDGIESFTEALMESDTLRYL
ncbi:putative uncharacterized protein DDB_G0277255 isoform X2 [Uranotaenia lowii]|uniref:putative uncharacterized protein DDB_G0277255 isoform X2 n=1 Tax=Uranotaenia lowii TaxID=190385 RepID=UPI00247A1BC2|nr:putative uncharacterized protein DDB_G0277255 isoform X2 [Uranotaenia lowii]